MKTLSRIIPSRLLTRLTARMMSVHDTPERATTR